MFGQLGQQINAKAKSTSIAEALQCQGVPSGVAFRATKER